MLFHPFVPYYLNQETFDDLTLAPYQSTDVEHINKDWMPVRKAFDAIWDNNGEYEFEFIGREYRLTIGKDVYSFDSFEGEDAPQILTLVLNANKSAGKWGDGFGCTWYFFEESRVTNDSHEFYSFFLCIGDRIVNPHVSISWHYPWSFPSRFLLPDTSTFSTTTAEDRDALTRLCYEKWETETLPGRIFAKKRMIALEHKEMEHALNGERRESDLKTPEIDLQSIRIEIAILRNQLKNISGLLFILTVAVIYMAVFK
jgi:hypothetical protein